MLDMYVSNVLSLKRFHGAETGNTHECLLKLSIGRVRKVMHRVWAYFQARLAFTMAAFNVLVQWHGFLPNASGFVPLSMAEFSL